MKYISLFLVLMFLNSCTSSKKTAKDALVKDSDFLKNGQVIEVFDPVAEPVKESAEESFNGAPSNKKTKKTKKKSSKESKTKVTKKTRRLEKKKNQLKQTLSPSPSVKKTQQKRKYPFVPGERVVLSAKYFGVEAGKITIGMFANKKVNGKKAAHFFAEGKSSSVFAMIYRIKDKVESLWDPVKERPFLIAFHIDEAKQKREIRTHFKWNEKKATTVEEGWKKKKGDYKKNKEVKLSKPGQDIMSAFFYLRTLPYEVGKTYNFNVLDEGKVINAQIHVEKKEVLSTRLGKFDSIVLKPNFQVEGKFKKVGDIRVWLTDDDYKQIIRVESKIKIGTIVAKLHSMERPK